MEELKKYKAVILAGGKGTRLYPVTKEIPKPLLPVKRKPILNYLVDLFYSYGIQEIAISISKEFRDDFGWWQRRHYPSTRSARSGQVPKIKFIEETEPLGTFGGLSYLKGWLGGTSFFFTNGDELKRINLKKMKDFHKSQKVPATIALVSVPNPHEYGVAVCKNGLIQKFLEKPSPAQISKKFGAGPKGKQAPFGAGPKGEQAPFGAGKKLSVPYISSGLYLLTPEIFDYHPGPKFSMIEKDLFPQLAKEKKLAGFQFEGGWMDCGTWERYEKALEKWR